MKKSIFLFFAAILCAIGANAKTIYLKPSSNWKEANAWFQVWDGKSNVKFNETAVGGLYKADIANDHSSKIYIKRMDPNNSSKVWAESEVTVGTYNCFSNDGWNTSMTRSNIIGVVAGGYILFDNSQTNWSDGYRYFVIGHDSYYKTIGGNSASTLVSNTKLWCIDANSESWADAKYFAFLSHDGSYPTANKAWSDIKQWGKQKTEQYTSTYSLNKNSIYLCVPTSGSGSPKFDINYKSNADALNSVITVKAKVSTNSGTSYADATSPGTLSASSFKFTTWNTCNTATSLSSGKITCGYTANTTLTAQTDVAGYSFAGWYNASGAKQTADATLKINPTENVTYYAYYIQEETHNVTVYYKNGSEEIGTQSTIGVGVKTSSEVLAKDIPGYQFTSWTWGAGIATTDPATANPIHITTTSTNDYTLTANYVTEVVYFVNSLGWNDVKAYAWTEGTNNSHNATWPGEAMRLTTEKFGDYQVYSYNAVPEKYQDIIFSNNGDAKTPDSKWTNGKYYVYNRNAWYNKEDVPAALIDTFSIVGDKALVGFHWNDEGKPEENMMTKKAGSETIYILEKNVTLPAGDYEYKAIRNYTYDWQVPNNSKNKVTINADGEGTIIYTLDIANYTLEHEIKNWVEKDLSNTVELFGIGENKTFIEVDRNTTSVNVELEANKVYSFEVIVNSVYMKNEGVMWRGNCEGWTFTPEGSRAHIITDLAGTYTFTWTYGANKQLTVTYPDDGANVPAPVFLAGKMNNWERLATRLIPSADGKTASAKVELERNVYNDFRMVIGTEDWTNEGTMDRGNCTGWPFDKVTEDNNDKNAGIVPDATGEYIFTWSYTDNTLSVTYPKQTCTECSNWYLCGDFNSWKLTDEFMQVEPKVVRAVVALEAGEEYKFKVQDMTNPRDGKWWGCKETINRASEELALEQQSGSEYNCTIVADLAGDYTFTWNTDTKKLTVTYPEIIIGDGDNSNVLNSLDGKTVDLKVTRSFASGKLYTLVLPFTMDNSTVTNVFGANVELYDFTSLSENNGELILKFTEQATPEIAAGTPYLIKPATNANGFDLTGVTINTTTTPVPQTDGTTTITMQPVLSATAEAKTNGTSQYWLAADNNLYNNVVSIKGLRVIFDVQTTKANVRARAAFNENVETGLDNNQLPISNIQKLIENGQLIIIREGVKYNVQGQVIR